MCTLQVLVVGNHRIDFTPHLECAQFATRSPKPSSYKKRGKWVVTTGIAAIHLNQSWKEKPRQVSMEADQFCNKRRIRCTRVIMQYLRHLPRLQIMHHSKFRNRIAPLHLITLPISSSHYSNKPRPNSRTRIRTRILIQR